MFARKQDLRGDRRGVWRPAHGGKFLRELVYIWIEPRSLSNQGHCRCFISSEGWLGTVVSTSCGVIWGQTMDPSPMATLLVTFGEGWFIYFQKDVVGE
jgi:hypothetical protein